VSDGWENLSLFGTCAVGVLFETSFVIVYIWFAPRDKKVIYRAYLDPMAKN
jgi:solute carrier family 50 protein (sugar transporter)